MFYEAVGGRDTFVRLVDRFYDGVATDPVMRGMYPAELGPARERMTAFLAQYWGGPRDYSEARGHPRLRMRHAPSGWTPTPRDRWLRHMRIGERDSQKAGRGVARSARSASRSRAASRIRPAGSYVGS